MRGLQKPHDVVLFLIKLLNVVVFRVKTHNFCNLLKFNWIIRMQSKTVLSKGFTLIELMTVVTIVGILAAIAYPSYTEHVRKTRRSLAEACLLELGQYMERYYTTNMSYASATLPSTQCRTDLTSFYTFAFSTDEPTGSTYQIESAPTGAQATDGCGTLTLDHTGSKNVVDAILTTAECW